MKKPPYVHCNFRLTETDKNQLELLAKKNELTVSEQVRKLFAQITHKLQMKPEEEPTRLLMREYYGRWNGSKPEKLDVKIQREVRDYLKFFGYNMTTVLIQALHEENR